MSLEVHIYGPGFGETIILRWRAGGGWKGALVDAHSPRDGRWLAEKLDSLGLRDLELVVATHPHLDHIRNLAAGLDRARIYPRISCYWPGLSPNYWMQFFDTLAAQRGDTDDHLPWTARMICRWFSYTTKGIRERSRHAFDIGGRTTADTFYETTAGGHRLRFTAIGPWLPGMNRLVRNVAMSIDGDGDIEYEHRHANDVSIALLIEYGEAQIVLGGDMEQINWNALTKVAKRPRFSPSLVKVSHHGSSNGRVDGMWPRAAGFFDGKAKNPVAVVTPWRQGSGILPDGDKVLKEIRDAGFQVYVTGQGSHRYRNPDSHVNVQIEHDGTVSAVDPSRDVLPL